MDYRVEPGGIANAKGCGRIAANFVESVAEKNREERKERGRGENYLPFAFFRITSYEP